eukprot:6195463-Pleurochrysis_carterae.AAC.2
MLFSKRARVRGPLGAAQHVGGDVGRLGEVGVGEEDGHVVCARTCVQGFFGLEGAGKGGTEVARRGDAGALC